MKFKCAIILGLGFGVGAIAAGASVTHAAEISVESSGDQLRAFAKLIRKSEGRIIIRIKKKAGVLNLSSEITDWMDGARSETEQVLSGQIKIQKQMRARGHQADHLFSLIPAMAGKLSLTEEAADTASLGELLANSEVEAIEFDEPHFLPVLSATSSEQDLATPQSLNIPWGVAYVNAPEAWALGGATPIRGAGVKISLMDTGGDNTHPDLHYAGGYDVTSSTNQTDPANWNDNIASCDGHGTHVAGTMAGLGNGSGVVGIAPDAQLYVMKVFVDISGSCGAFTSVQIAALQWAVSQGIRVVNSSIGGGWSGAFATAITAAVAQGTYMVAAAGNDGTNQMQYPGAYPNVFSAGSINSGGGRSSFSDYGPGLTAVTPGEGITSTLPGGGYGSKSGTSMASPHMAGTVGLILQVKPTATFQDITSILAATSTDLGAPGRDDQYGDGAVNAQAAVAMAMGGTVPVADPTLANAESDLLSGGVLTAGVRTALDQRGNGDGQFDLGDVLELKVRLGS